MQALMQALMQETPAASLLEQPRVHCLNYLIGHVSYRFHYCRTQGSHTWAMVGVRCEDVIWGWV